MEVMESNVASLKCSGAVQESVARYAAELAEALGANLLGIYLYGSLARGCHNPVTSDVDIVVVTEQECAEVAGPAILQIHRDAGVPLDAVFITRTQSLADLFPTPVGFVVKTGSKYEIFRDPDVSRDFLLQRQDVHEAGIPLAGPMPTELLQPVPWPLLAECLDFLFPNIVPYFKNPVLMLCRIAYVWTHRRLSCKRSAGEWAATTLDRRWSRLIRTALAEYALGHASTSITPEDISAFEEHCARYIGEMRTDTPSRCTRATP